MKDQRGHGSNGGLTHKKTPVRSENAPFKSRFKRGQSCLDPKDPRAKVAKGRMSPEQANKGKHGADAVLGKHDHSYHNIDQPKNTSAAYASGTARVKPIRTHGWGK